MPAHLSASDIPTVAIIGRPNVGKSSLFNRLTGRRKAIIDRFAGTTRDRLYSLCSFKDRNFRLVDTGGIDLNNKSAISASVQKQVSAAIEESQLLLFVCDGKDGIMPLDRDVASILRKTNKKILLAINKIDDLRDEGRVFEFYELGIGEPTAVSASQGRGIDRLLNLIASNIPERFEISQEERTNIAIVGRPNVGKSSFLNALVKEERVIVDSAPGTTRDSIDTYFETDDEKFVLIDTAGMRHKRKFKEPVEVFSLSRTKEAMRRSDGCIIILDANEGMAQDDLKIIDAVIEAGRSALLCINKWDLIKGMQQLDYERSLRGRAKFTGYIPMIFTSALSGHNIYKSILILSGCIKNAKTRIETPALNKLLAEAQERHSPPHYKNVKPKLFYITQTDIAPPQFLIFANRPDCVAPAYLNYLDGQIRRRYNFTGTPIKFALRKK